ncbi:MAG: hypothetical protein NVSMB42_09290 [Herpetosiphon sp.]
MLTDFEQEIKALTLVPSLGGRFEVTVDGKLMFSKAELGRHAEPEEILQALKTGIPVTD